jgi:hypothetical protein
VFIVENYLASRSYLTCQNEFRDTFPDSAVSDIRIIDKYWAVHFKYHCRNSSPCCIKHEEKSECMHVWTWWTFPTLNITLFLFSDFNVIYFLTNRTCVRNWLHYFSITLYKHSLISRKPTFIAFLVLDQESITGFGITIHNTIHRHCICPSATQYRANAGEMPHFSK